VKAIVCLCFAKKQANSNYAQIHDGCTIETSCDETLHLTAGVRKRDAEAAIEVGKSPFRSPRIKKVVSTQVNIRRENVVVELFHFLF
jgi:hypothetical protein